MKPRPGVTPIYLRRKAEAEAAKLAESMETTLSLTPPRPPETCPISSLSDAMETTLSLGSGPTIASEARVGRRAARRQ